VLAAIKQANQAVEGWEKGTVGAGEKTQKSLERMGKRRLLDWNLPKPWPHDDATQRLRPGRRTIRGWPSRDARVRAGAVVERGVQQ
jgi:hypothetical protein